MSKVRQEGAAQAAADRLHNRFPNLVVAEDFELGWQDLPYKEVFRCTSPTGPRLSGKVYPSGSLAIEIDMLSSNEFERIMIALWGDRDSKLKAQYVFTVGARPKPTKVRSKK